VREEEYKNGFKSKGKEEGEGEEGRHGALMELRRSDEMSEEVAGRTDFYTGHAVQLLVGRIWTCRPPKV